MTYIVKIINFLLLKALFFLMYKILSSNSISDGICDTSYIIFTDWSDFPL